MSDIAIMDRYRENAQTKIAVTPAGVLQLAQIDLLNKDFKGDKAIVIFRDSEEGVTWVYFSDMPFETKVGILTLAQDVLLGNKE